MRGAGAAGDLSVDSGVGHDRAELRALRDRLLQLEQEISQLRERLEALESGQVGTAIAARPETPIEEPVELGRSIHEALGQGFNLAAVIALVLAVGFVARIGFGQGSIVSLFAVAAGCAALLALAYMFQRRGHARLSLWLEGGAVGVGYLAAYAAFAAWHSLPLALPAATAVTIAGVAVSLARQSQAIAVFAVFGAVLTPLLMRDGGVQPGEHASSLLFAYLALLNVTTLVLSRLRDWRWQAASSLLATHFLAWLWFAEHRQANPALTLVFPCVTFAVFLLRPLVRIRRDAGWLEKGIAAANTLLFLAALQTLLFAYAPQLLPFAPLALGLVYGAAAGSFGARTGLASTHLVLMTILLVPGAWYAFPDFAALLWIALGMLLGNLGLRYEHWLARMTGYALIAAAMLLTPRAYVVLPAVAAGAWYVSRARRESPRVGDLEWLARWGLIGAMLLGCLAASTLELRALLARPAFAGLASGAQFFHSLVIAVYAGVLAVWNRSHVSAFFRACGLILFGALTLKVFVLDLAALSGGWRIGSLILLAISLLAISTRRSSKSGGVEN